MSRDEAIKVLKEYLELDKDIDSEYLEAQKVAIKAIEELKQEKQELKQESCEDAVSRKAVIDAIFAECSGEKLDIDFAKVLLLQRAIKALPPATPTQKWIPVSDRLPEPINHREYLVTTAHYDPTYKGRFTMLDEYEARDETVAPYWEKHREKDGIRVVAWMPLPEPYKGSEEE